MTMAIGGTGHRGLSNGILFAQYNKVLALNIIPEKVKMYNQNISLIEDTKIEAKAYTRDLFSSD